MRLVGARVSGKTYFAYSVFGFSQESKIIVDDIANNNDTLGLYARTGFYEIGRGEKFFRPSV